MTRRIVLAFIFFACSVGLNDVEDTLVHHYDTSVFAENGHDSFWYPDWTRKYVDGDPDKGRKKWLGLEIPALFFDGWHLVKVVRQWAMLTSLFFLFIGAIGIKPYELTIFGWIVFYLSWVISNGLFIMFVHEILYEEILINAF